MIFLTSDFINLGKADVLYFYNDFPYNKRLASVLSNLEEKYTDFSFQAANIDIYKSLIKRFKLESVPTILFLRNGKEIDRIVGMVMSSALKSKFIEVNKRIYGKENNE